MAADSTPLPQTPARAPADRRRRASDVDPALAEGRLALVGGGVSFRVRRLEPKVAWMVTGFILWVNVVINPMGSAVWALALLVACVGGWSGMFPARHQWMLLLRGTLLTAGTMLLYLVADTGGPTGPYFFPSVLVVFSYALLLSTPGAAVLSGLVLAEFCTACWLAQPSPPWRDVFIYGGLLAVIPPLAMLFGQSMRQSDNRAESSMRDSRTLLYNETGFFVHGAMLLADCVQRERPFSMVLLNGADLRDIPGQLGRKVANDLFAQVVQGIGAVPGEGIAARTDSVEFALLLPGVTKEKAAALVHQQLGNPPKVNVYMAGKPVVVGLDMVVAHTQNKNRTIESIYDVLRARLNEPRNAIPAASVTTATQVTSAAPPMPVATAMPAATAAPALPT